MRRRRLIVAASLLLVAALFWLPLARHAPPAAGPEPERDIEGPAADTKSSTARSGPLARVAEQAQLDTPIIDRVIVEKDELCEGEENLISVEAHMPNESDNGYLRYMVSSTTGRQVPLRSFLPGQVPEPPRYILVHGKNGESARVEVPAFKIKRCREARALFLKSGALANTVDEYQFWATIESVEARTQFAPVRYEWTFSDGSRETTQHPRTTHRFTQEHRLFSNYLVSCTAIARDGEKVTGRMALELTNVEQQALAFKGVVLLSIAGSPRFPEIDGEGSVEQTIRIWHHQDLPVRVDKVSVRYVRDDGSEESSEAAVSSILGTTEVTREGIETTLRLDTRAQPNVTMVDYQFTGTSADGLPVSGHFSLMKPPPPPTRESHPVLSPVLLAKIGRAREHLKKDTITDDDLWQLEQDGVFADLKVDVVAPEGLPATSGPKGFEGGGQEPR